jgi:hypothetical protein
MYRILTLAFFLSSLGLHAQDDPCLERILAKQGNWVKGSITKNNTPDYDMQKKFLDAVHSMMQSYQPKGVQAQTFAVHTPAAYGNPFHAYKYWIGGFSYFCSGDDKLTLAHETYNGFRVHINNDFNRLLFDNKTDYDGTGFSKLREGIPEEVKPGVWRFKEVWTPLGFQREGLTKLWLLTYPGQLPWQYVTRREFLQNRRRMLLTKVKDEENDLQQKLVDLEKTKKNIEKVTKDNPAQYATWIKNEYEPAPARYRAQHEKATANLKLAIDRVNEQLEAPDTELNKKAIVIRSEKNFLDYTFTENWQERFAEVLIKPNPAYFKKGLSPSVPQLIEVSIQYYQLDKVSVLFAETTEKLVNVEYLQSFIGKTTPPAFTGSSSSQNQVGSTTNKVSAPASSGQSTSSSTTNKETTSKPLTPQGPLASNGMFLTGTLSAPAGVPVTLAYNNGNDLTITPSKGNGNLYTTSSIRFSKPLKEEEAYNVMLKKIASNMKGVVYYGKGKAPGDVNKIKVGVDFTYELLTRSSDDKVMSSFYESFTPAVGGFQGEEGRYVVFVSATKDFAGSNGKFRQVFWRDRNTGVTKMISVSASGEQGNADCAEPSISADGQTVVFESKATNLVDADNNNVKDIFLWRKSTNSIELISKATNGGAADAESFDACISGNGNFVVFTSLATNLAAVPKGRSLANIFLRDIVTGKTEMISVDPVAKTGGNGYKASISFDGSRISFCSPSGTLVANDNNNLWDIFLWQRGQSGLKRISMTHDGKERNGGTESASRQVASAISGNGRFVAFATTASNMVPNDNNNFQDVFVVDVETGKVNVASFTDDGQPSNNDSPIEQGERVAISYDGKWVAFPTKATNLGAADSNIILYNTVSGKKTAASNVTGSYVGRPSISYSGSYVLFGKSVNLDNRFSNSGIFAHFTRNGPCRDCK